MSVPVSKKNTTAHHENNHISMADYCSSKFETLISALKLVNMYIKFVPILQRVHLNTHAVSQQRD